MIINLTAKPLASLTPSMKTDLCVLASDHCEKNTGRSSVFDAAGVFHCADAMLFHH